MNNLDVSITVINWNTKDLLRSCLRSVIDAQPLAGHSIKVIDNHSTDGSQQMVKDEFPTVDLIENGGNLGFSAAANQALRQSSAKYVFLLNSDTEIDHDAVDILLDFAEHHPDVAVVGPMLLNTDGSVQISGRNFPSFADATMHAFLGVVWPENPWSVRYKMLDWDRQSQRSVDWVSGAAMLVRCQAAREVNFFDENFFMYVEDLDLCYRLKKKSWRIFFLPEAKVLHHIGKSSEQSNNKMIIEFQKSMYRFYSKKYGGWRRLLKPLVIMGLSIRTLLLMAASAYFRLSAGMKAKEEEEQKEV